MKLMSYAVCKLSLIYNFILAFAFKVILIKRWESFESSKQHGLPGQLIISLTSYPARFITLHLTLKSLLSQTISPDRIILWISDDDKGLLSEDILSLQKHNLEIMYCEDLKSYKKIIPLLRFTQDAFVATADDDAYYWPTWLEELAAAYSGDNSEVLCHRAHKIRMQDISRPLRYNDWVYETKETPPSSLIFPTGVGGVLYPPRIFHSDVMDEDSFMTLCPLGDDIWLYWMVRLAGGRARKIGPRRKLVFWPETQASAISIANCLQEDNDKKIDAMVKRYGFPPEDAMAP